MSEPNTNGMVTSINNTADSQGTPASVPARSDRSSSNEISQIEVDDHDDAAGLRPTPNMAEPVEGESYDGDDDEDGDDDDVSSLNLNEDMVQAEEVHEDASDDLEDGETESPLLFYDEENDRLIEVFPSTSAMQFWDPQLRTYNF